MYVANVSSLRHTARSFSIARRTDATLALPLSSASQATVARANPCVGYPLQAYAPDAAVTLIRHAAKSSMR